MCSWKNEVFKSAAKLFGYPLDDENSHDSVSKYDEYQWDKPCFEDSTIIILEFIESAEEDELILAGLNSLRSCLQANSSGIASRLANLADSSNENIRCSVVDVFASIQDTDSIDLLVSMHKDDSTNVRSLVSKVLAELPLEKLFVKPVKEALVWLMDDLDELISCSAIKGLMRIHAPEIYGHLQAIIINDELGSEHFDLIEQYGVYQFRQDLAELSHCLSHNDLYESRPQWWKDSFEELTNSSNSQQ
tara:strand:- start:218 stop:958 length:741 start_codon:yes stop_codon:yes gene_type:complete